MGLIRLLRTLIGKVIARPIYRQLAQFEKAIQTPRQTQETLLRQILARQTDTDFGRAHHFRVIHGRQDFQRHLPVAGYDYYEPYLERVCKGDFNALLADRRVHMFALTSGTTAARKYIPVTDQYLADFRKGWNLWGLKVFRDHPEVKIRPMLQISGDMNEFVTDAGIPCGSVTGLTAKVQRRIIRWLYCVPYCVSQVKEVTSKYYLILRLSLPRRVGMVIAANPSTLVNLARAGDQDKEALIRDLHDGTLSPHCQIPGEIRSALGWKLRRKHRDRARELEEIVRRTGTLYPRDYWGPDCLLGNWTGGSMGAYLRQYPRYFGAMPVRDVGLIASEGRMTIPFADATPSGVLDITSHYFEFLPEEEEKSPNPSVLAAHEVQEGRKYFILLTTAYGLYRYHIHDLVRVTGFYQGAPLIEFLNKGSNFANITGEKVSEYHVTQAMADVLRELDLSLTSYTVAPCWDEEQPYYGLFVEDGDLPHQEQRGVLAELLDHRLGQLNMEYHSKRASRRLGPLRIALLPSGTWSQWDRQRLLKTGGTLEQYKHPCLIPDLHFRETMPVQEEVLASASRNGQH